MCVPLLLLRLVHDKERAEAIEFLRLPGFPAFESGQCYAKAWVSLVWRSLCAEEK